MAATAKANKQLPKPVDFDQLYPGRFLKSGELLGRKRTVTIDHVDIEELENEKGKKVQGVVVLKETEKQIVLNKTNGLCLRGMFGRKLSAWEGKRITIFQDQVKFGADTVDAIRIWGSPDIERDMDVIISLPKKRPFTMTMHKVVLDRDQPAPPAQQPAAAARQPSGTRTPYTEASGIAALNACQDDLTRAAIWNEIQADLEAAGIEISNELDAANHAAKERLQQL